MTETDRPILAIIDPETSAARRIVMLRDVLHRTSIPSSTLYEMIAMGDFPKPLMISPRLNAWIEGEVDAWIQARMDERRRRS